jgi:hypothetical protein
MIKELSYIDSYNNQMNIQYDSSDRELVISINESGFEIHEVELIDVLIEQLHESQNRTH